MNWSLEKKIQAGFAISLAILGTAAVLGLQSIAKQAEATSEVANTRQVLLKLNQTMVGLLETESGLRGYVITGEERYLKTYSSGMASVDGDLNGLKDLAKDNPNQERDIASLHAAVDRRIAHLKVTLEMRSARGFEAVQERLRAGRATELMDEVRRSVVELEREADALLTRQIRTRDEALRFTIWLNAAFILLVAVVLGTSFHLIWRDMAARKTAQERIKDLNDDLKRRVSDLDALNHELEAFTYSVSHDLRAPLRHIDGFSKLLLEEHGAGLSDEARRYLTRIREGARLMGQLVDDLLNLARVGRKELSIKMTGLNSLVEEVMRGLRTEISSREVEWKVGPLPFVECDPGLLKQVFANLLSNAVKFTRPRTQGFIEVGAVGRDGTSTIFVRDNGVGFSMKYAEKLFGVFQRLHRQEDFEGTGIGLATVQRIVQKHGGRVWAEAGLDKGATFFFTLGLQPEVEPANPPGGGR